MWLVSIDDVTHEPLHMYLKREGRHRQLNMSFVVQRYLSNIWEKEQVGQFDENMHELDVLIIISQHFSRIKRYSGRMLKLQCWYLHVFIFTKTKFYHVLKKWKKRKDIMICVYVLIWSYLLLYFCFLFLLRTKMMGRKGEVSPCARIAYLFSLYEKDRA